MGQMSAGEIRELARDIEFELERERTVGKREGERIH